LGIPESNCVSGSRFDLYPEGVGWNVIVKVRDDVFVDSTQDEAQRVVRRIHTPAHGPFWEVPACESFVVAEQLSH